MKVDFITDIASSGGFKTSEFNIDLAKKSKLVTILSDSLYRNKIMSMIRETCSNAYDSHVMKGNTDQPFDFTVPTWEHAFYELRDYGTGLTPEEADKTIFSYLGSSKDNSDDFIGGWGLGSKSPYAYTNAFEVVLYKDSHYWHYNCWKDAGGLPQHGIFEEGKTDLPDGVKIIVPVKSDDIWNFRSNCVSYLEDTNFNINVVNSNITTIKKKKILHSFEHEGFKYSFSNHRNNGQLLILYGGFIYAVNELNSNLETETQRIFKELLASSQHSILLEVPVGACDFNVSRESIAGSVKTLAFINKAVTKLIEFLEQQAIEYYEVYVKRLKEYCEENKDSLDLSHIKDFQVKHGNKNPIFGFIQYSNFVKRLASPEVKQIIDQSKSDFDITIELKHTTIPTNKKPLNTENCLKKIEIGYKSDRRVANVYRCTRLRLNLLMPIDKQYIFCYSETRVYAKYLEVGSVDERTSIICVEKADSSIAETVFKTLGFTGIDLSPLDEIVGVLDRESIIRKKHVLPKLITCAYNGDRVEYDSVTKFVYWKPDEIFPGHGQRYLKRMLNIVYFRASDAFLKKFAGKLPNVVHWSVACTNGYINTKEVRQQLINEYQLDYLSKHNLTDLVGYKRNLPKIASLFGITLENLSSLPTVTSRYHESNLSYIKSFCRSVGIEVTEQQIEKHKDIQSLIQLKTLIDSIPIINWEEVLKLDSFNVCQLSHLIESILERQNEQEV